MKNLILCLILCGSVGAFMHNVNKNKTHEWDADYLEEVAQSVNNALPAPPNNGTQLFNVFSSGMTMTYDYKWLEIASADVDRHNLENYYFLDIKNLACSSTETRELIDKGVTVKTRYHGSDDVLVGTLTIEPGDCDLYAER